MQNTLINNRAKSFFLLVVFLIISLFSTTTLSWGREGHAVVGILAMQQLQPEARSELEKFMGSLDDQSMLKACNWPDEVRETPEWEWSYPLHYVNIPRGDFEYLESRDCPTQECATEAIKRYSTELANADASTEKRWQAFAWVCHLVGDLHQPLHAGFADDRGGNDFEVVYRGEETNLHSIWDSKIIQQHTENTQDLTRRVAALPTCKLNEKLSRELINNWTNESHELTKTQIYPSSSGIGEDYEARSWTLIQERLNNAAIRLALIINSVLAEPTEAERESE